jgi:2,3-bisphosphoglycerate-independent phosphoglycerate mutase
MTSVNRTQEGMRYAVLVGDGMADHPLEEIDGRTPLEVASIPHMDEIARQGQLGLVRTVPPGLSPGSDVAILSILGYDPKQHYPGRAPLEATRLGIELSSEEVAFRCNLVTVDDGLITDYSGGHISSGEAEELIGFLEQKLGTESVTFYPGVGYRHICVIKDPGLMHVDCTPPHDVIGEPIEKNLPRGEAAQYLRDLMMRSYDLLRAHEANRARMGKGENPANMIWLWGQGGTPRMPSFSERYGIWGGVISAVDLVKGIAKLIGLEPIEVPGATGYYDTDYEAKGDYAVRCLEKIESFDRHVVGSVVERFGGQPTFRLLVLPDHPTPIRLRTHTGDPVPFAWCGPGIERAEASAFNEREAALSGLSIEAGHQLMERFVGCQK